jgi:hypothetical protein
MERIRKTLVLAAVIAVPAAAHGTFTSQDSLCFASGSATYRLSPTAVSPDYRVRIDNDTPRPDLRMRLVDRPEIADIVLADDTSGAPSTACRSAVRIKTIRIDAEARKPDVTVALSTEVDQPDYKVYVHSMRFSHQDAAAFLAAMWKATQTRELAAAR